MLIFQSIWLYFRNLTWNDLLTIVVVAGAIASTLVPYLDASTFRGVLLAFIAITLKLQNLGNSQEIKRTRYMIKSLGEQADSIANAQNDTIVANGNLPNILSAANPTLPSTTK